MGQPGTYTVTVVARRDGQEIGTDKGRFLVYQDDRELENPSADLLPGAADRRRSPSGEAVAPERLTNYLKGLDRSAYTEYRQPVGIQRLGQLALPPDLHGATDRGVVAAQAPWMGLSDDQISGYEMGFHLT